MFKNRAPRTEMAEEKQPVEIKPVRFEKPLKGGN